MPILRLFTPLIFFILMVSCGSSDTKGKNFSLSIDAKDHTIQIGEKVSFSIKNPQNLEVTSVDYSLDGNPISENLETSDLLLGEHLVSALISYGDENEEAQTTLTILNNEQPKIYSYKIINEYPHDITSYTQGLEFHNGILYESTGQYKESKLRKVDYKTGEVLENVNLKDVYFGEGLTVMDDKVYQLTWRAGTGFVYDAETLEKTSSFKYGKSKEGWGLCNDGSQIYKSDGTENIWLLNTETLTEESKIQAYHNRGKVIELNELEWVDGKIYANRYQKNGVAIIDPTSGAVTGVIDFTPLKNQVTQHGGLDVLNGIAYNPETKTIFVTGKRWDKLFEVEVFEK